MSVFQALTRRKLRGITLALLGLTLVTGCESPFSAHGDDVRAAYAKKLHSAHRRWDRYFNGLDWDDPSVEWHDESYARGPMVR